MVINCVGDITGYGKTLIELYNQLPSGYDEKFLSLWRTNRGSESAANYGSIDDLFKCRPSLLY